MNTRDRHRLERHARRIEELRLWRNASERPVQEWSFATGNGEPPRSYDLVQRRFAADSLRSMAAAVECGGQQ